MFGQVMTTRTLAVLMLITTGLMTGEAEAGIRALLVASSGGAGNGDLAALRAALRQDGHVPDVQVIAPLEPVAMAATIRTFLSTPIQSGELRLVWVAGGGYGSVNSACPPWSEEAVRPSGPSVIVAPACFKLLVQPATPYERFDSKSHDGDGDAPLYMVAPAVAFFTAPEGESGGGANLPLDRAVADTLRSGTKLPLVTSLSCRQPVGGSSLAADFSPSASAWGVHAADCRPAEAPVNVAVVAPPSARTVPKMASPPPVEVKRDAIAANATLHFSPPVAGRVVTSFGSQPGPGAAVNKGIDFEASPGAVVTAAEGGEVVFAGELPRYGAVIAVKHNNEWATVYGKAVNVRVTKGTLVGKGQPLAEIGQNTRGFHFEVRRKGKAVDPQPLITPVG
ncbi:MAG: peptidoglycan DD-metalloendopeptidase family protein [Alphaproteobacteria bacterium]